MKQKPTPPLFQINDSVVWRDRPQYNYKPGTIKKRKGRGADRIYKVVGLGPFQYFWLEEKDLMLASEVGQPAPLPPPTLEPTTTCHTSYYLMRYGYDQILRTTVDESEPEDPKEPIFRDHFTAVVGEKPGKVQMFGTPFLSPEHAEKEAYHLLRGMGRMEGFVVEVTVRADVVPIKHIPQPTGPHENAHLALPGHWILSPFHNEPDA